jgi:hypothetical protein
LDKLVDTILVPVRSGERSKYPRSNFARGISNLKLLTASEWAGVAFSISLIVCSEQGFDLFDRVFKRRGVLRNNEDRNVPEDGECLDDNDDSSSHDDDDDDCNDNNAVGDNEDRNGKANKVAIDPTDILYVLEMLLSFHAWYKCGGPYKCGNAADTLKIHKAISKMLETVKEKVPRNIRNGWKLQKFHDLLHVSRDMSMFGNPQNWDASPGEHNLIDFAKRPARRTQKRHSTFMLQVTDRLQENAVLEKASAYVRMTSSKFGEGQTIAEPVTGIVGKPYASIVREMNHHKFVVNSNTKHLSEIHPFLKDWIMEDCDKEDSLFHMCEVVECFYEYKRSGNLYRAHPDYRGMGPWHDWVMVTFAQAGARLIAQATRNHHAAKHYFQPDEYPCKIFCFLKRSDNNEIFAVVQSCKENEHEDDSILYQRWQKEFEDVVGGGSRPWLHIVPVDSFGDRVLVIEDDPSLKELEIKRQQNAGCTLVLPREEWWSHQFISI